MVITLFVTGFFAAYFQLLRHPFFPVTVMPLLTVDRLVGFAPAALAVYASLWIYVFLAPSLLRGWSELWAYAGGALVITVVGLGLFWVWPTAVPRPEIDWAQYPAFAFLQHIDSAGNACPSLHVAFAVFTAVWLERILRRVGAPGGWTLLNVGWCALIIYSTLATKQHVAIDALAGTVLGLVGGLWRPGDAVAARLAFTPWANRQGYAFALSLSAKLLILVLPPGPEYGLAAALLFFGPDCWILAGLLVPNTRSLTPVARRFATSRKEVWLTIDDGPDPATTRRMLDVLDRHGARATFFVIGAQVAAQPGLVLEIAARGHTLGNHTQTHPLATFWTASPGRTAREIDGCAAALQTAAVSPVAWFRPPAGIRSFFLRRALARRGLLLVGWSGRGREQLGAAVARPLRRLKRKARPGAILLLHESARHPEARVALLTGLLEYLAAQGYRCVLPDRTDLR